MTAPQIAKLPIRIYGSALQYCPAGRPEEGKLGRVVPAKILKSTNVLTQIDYEGGDDGSNTGRHGATPNGHAPDDGGEELRGNGVHHTKGSRDAELPQHFQQDGNTWQP